MSEAASVVTQPEPAMNIRPKKRKVRIKTLIALYLLVSPMVILLFIFKYIPMYGVIIAFKDFSVYKGILGSDWVGFKHFEYFLTDEKFWQVMRNTIIINCYDIIFGFTAPIIFALLANEIYQKTFKRVVQTISYAVFCLKKKKIKGIFYQFLSPETGMFNRFLGLFGIEPIYFMTEPSIFRGILVFADIWKNVGWSAILYFAVIAGIDSHLYDAAWIDGAGRFRQVFVITLPHMMPMITLLFLLRLAHIFGIGFDRVFLMQNPLVYDVSDVISTYVYRLGLEQAQYSLTTAIGLTESVLGFVLLIGSNWLSKRISGMGLY